MSLRYQIVLHKSEEGYAVNCPALPGCWSQGETEQEAMQNIRDAIEDYLAAVNGVPSMSLASPRLHSFPSHAFEKLEVRKKK